MKKKILLIDDNKYLLDVFVIRLSMAMPDYTILTARNGKRGVEVLKSASIEFILTDLDMPEMDGFQFIEYAQQHYPEIPVYAMSSDCSLEVGRRLRSMGIADCIEKPFLVEEVTHRIMKEIGADAGGPREEFPGGRRRPYVVDMLPN